MDGKWMLYNFDPVQFTSTKVGEIVPSVGLDLEGARWHPTNPDVFYALEPSTQRRIVYSYNVATKAATIVKDFTTIAPIGGYPSSLSMSADGRYLAFYSSTTGGQDTGDFLVAYDTQTQAVYTKNVLTDLGIKNVHSAFLDKAGDYLWVQTGYASLNEPGVRIWNFKTGTFETLMFNASDSPGGHWAHGYGKSINPHWDGGKLAMRNLATPHTYSTVVVWPPRDGRINWQTDSHMSWNNKQNEFFFQSNYIASRVTGWESYAGPIYMRSAFTANSLTQRAPEGAYHNGKALSKSATLPTGPGKWFYDQGSDTLYVWLFNNADATAASEAVVPFAWWPIVEEIVQVWIDDATNLTKIKRLAHHQSHWPNTSSDGYTDTPRASADPSGQFVLWTSNWGGSGHRDVFILKVP
jgi:hypothetical protein